MIVVVAILGILAAIAVPRFLGATATAETNAHNANVQMLEKAAELAIANGEDADDIDAEYLEINNYISEVPKTPKATGGVDKGEEYKVEVTTTVTAEGQTIAIVVTPGKE